MCDTLVATGSATSSGVTIFGKNSDREPNEAQHLVQIPAAVHPQGSRVRCTYVEIPQAPETCAVLLSKPFWIWGAEIGVNEHGVAIGNEAVFSRIPSPKQERLIGMDLLRLGLERASSASQAVSVITDLLEQYGQGGNCGYAHPSYYHNSFLVADSQEAWVLETVEQRWAAKRVEEVYTISNGLTIGGEWDQASDDLADFAIRKGWCRGRKDFNFAGCYSDFLYTRFSDSRHRRSCSTGILNNRRGRIDIHTVLSALRDHGEAGKAYRPDHSLFRWQLCVHATAGPVINSQSTGSLSAILGPGGPLVFATGTSAPCTSIYKPVWPDAPLPDTGPDPNGEFDSKTLYWHHELLHRSTLLDFPTRSAVYRSERDELEESFIRQALACAEASKAERAALSARCFQAAAQAESGWLERVRNTPSQTHNNRLYARAWNNYNHQAKLPCLE